jgi:hypothetical protein
MSRIALAVGALALLAVAGCGTTVPGDAYPAGAAPVDGRTAPGAAAPIGGRDAGGATGSIDLCATMSSSELAEVGLAGAGGRMIGGPVASCQWKVPGEFVPVVLMLSPTDDLDAIATATGAGGGTHRTTEMAGLPAIEGATATGDGCNVYVQHPAGVLSLLTPGSCDQARRIVERVVPDLPA